MPYSEDVTAEIVSLSAYEAQVSALLTEDERMAARRRLDRLAEEILVAVPGARIAADQPYRIADLAIDYREDTGPLPAARGGLPIGAGAGIRRGPGTRALAA